MAIDTSNAKNELPALLTTAQVADWMGVGAATVRIWARDGKLPTLPRMGDYRFSRDALILWMEKNDE
jgi:excisionase family DNA binding protein